MASIFKEVDQDSDNKTMLSSIDIQEYWLNIKRAAHTENRIISEMVDGKTGEASKEGFEETVANALRKQNAPEQNAEDEQDDMLLNSPRNEFERMLHRKIYELNKLQTDYHSLQLENQKEKNLRLKAEENCLKQRRQHESEKKNLAINIKNQVQQYFERRVMNTGLLYRKEIVYFKSNYRMPFRNSSKVLEMIY